jgi:hypothetical protein
MGVGMFDAHGLRSQWFSEIISIGKAGRRAYPSRGE